MRIVLLAALLLLAAPAAAQQAPAPAQSVPGGDDIIVQGKKDRDAQVRGFVRDLAVLNGTTPIGRFDRTALCPGVAGLSEPMNAAIAARMRRVAGAANIPLAKPGCRTNALVIIAPGTKAEVIAELHRRAPVYFTDLTDRPTVIARQPGPATAWHLGGYIDRSGAAVPYNDDFRAYFLNSPVTPSRISASVRPVFFASVVVIEREAVIGLTTTQVADYAAMRTFADIDPARLGGSSAPTIVTVLDAGPDTPIPPTLTEWDLGYLRALYAIPAEHYGPRQRTEVRRRMIREMDKAAGI